MKLVYFSEPILWAEYFDHQKIHSPLNVTKFQELLESHKYDNQEMRYLINGLRNGFSIEYDGPREGVRTSNNLKLRVGSKTKLWNKLMKEVEKKRVAGPYRADNMPFDWFYQSPVGLVAKKNTGGEQKLGAGPSLVTRGESEGQNQDVRMIFHLSHPKGSSINDYINPEKCRVKYHNLDEAVSYSHQLVSQGATEVWYSSCDLKSAFRFLGICNCDKPLLVMKGQHPDSGGWYYFIELALPFGCSISPKIFQRFSKTTAFLVGKITNRRQPLVYLDDFLNIKNSEKTCNKCLKTLLQVCEWINFPVSHEKTCWAATSAIFLGLLLNGRKHIICVPPEKKEIALQLISIMEAEKKTKVIQIQKLAGTLNFIGRAIVPGRAFNRRFYHYHVRVDREMRKDLSVWTTFLQEENDTICRPFLDIVGLQAVAEIEFLTDASRTIGFGGFCQGSFFHEVWESQDWVESHDISICWMELYALTVGIILFGHRFENQRVRLFCDNQSVVGMINNSTSSCKRCMVLIRIIR